MGLRPQNLPGDEEITFANAVYATRCAKLSRNRYITMPLRSALTRLSDSLTGEQITEMKLDRIDLKILRKLQTDGRISNVHLADAVGLSASPCLARVKRLEAVGIITGYEAQFDLAKLDNFVTAYVQVILKNHRRVEAQRFEKFVSRIREVVEFHMVNGKFDYLMKIVALGYDGPTRILQEMWQSDLGVQSYSIFIVSGIPIQNRPLPVDD